MFTAMLSLLLQHPWLAGVSLLLLVLLTYTGWIWWRQRVSKARFSLSIVGTLASLPVALLAFLSSSPLGSLINFANKKLGIDLPTLDDGPDFLQGMIALLATLAANYTIYRLARATLTHWDGPVTVEVNELAKYSQDTSILRLAALEFRRIATLQPERLASEAAVNWEQRQAEAPATPPWHVLAKNLFEAAFRETAIDESSWRDRISAWIGHTYTAQSPQSSAPLVLLVLDDEPTSEFMSNRVSLLRQDGVDVEHARICAVFRGGGSDVAPRQIGRSTIEIWPQQSLLKHSLDFNEYARDLVRRFDVDTLGGTAATLHDTFVEAHVNERGMRERRPLGQVLQEWAIDPTRRHLAITGEYGQGKSTAMLAFCVGWAKRWLSTGYNSERIPLLIELRGQNPAEVDPVTFLSAWAGRYALPPKQLYNLVRSGQAILIFEGFDELRNAGRAFDRHEHFNALWRFAYPGTKVLFTGRPNFFIDDREKNRTLRTDPNRGAAGNAYTQLFELDRLTMSEVEIVARGFGPGFQQAIMEASVAHPAFFEIVSRPSMLPVVATIWPTILQVQKSGHDLTGAVLLERYIQAVYMRKEEEIERDRRVIEAPAGASYLLLPREARELFTLCVVWKMASADLRNTITRQGFNAIIFDSIDDILQAFQTEGADPAAASSIRAFEERFRDETKGEKVERVANEIATAGLFVPDPVGGPSNLRLPHKQFYEYLIAKAAWVVLSGQHPHSAAVIKNVDSGSAYQKLLSEDLPASFFWRASRA